MENILDANDNFLFDKLVLTKPTLISGGNYFIRFLVNDNPLYIQPPKCKLKQGIAKAGKRMYADIMFTNENDQFIRWMENLEIHCHKYIYNNREQWFDGEMELHDIENYFTSPLKPYKSGNFFIVRTNIKTALGNSVLKIYDENENEVNMDNITENMNVMTILEFQGIKCSARSFQIDIELKQMLVLKPTNIFDKCLFKQLSNVNTMNDNNYTNDKLNMQQQDAIETSNDNIVTQNTYENEILNDTQDILGKNQSNIVDDENSNEIVIDTLPQDENKIIEEIERVNTEEDNNNPNENNLEIKINNDGLEEIEFNLDELSQDNTIQIKQRNDVYYEMYREARRKAKIARNLALSSYLEAKRIKNAYMLEDIKDSDDSDFEYDEEQLTD